jgi:tetratricopeptide (TPR) repeat protein
MPKAPTAPAKPAEGAAPRSTMIFGGAPAQKPVAPASPAPAPVPEPPAPVPARAEENAPPEQEAEEEAAPEAPGADEREETAREPGPFDKAPPRGLLIGVAAGLALLLVVGGGLVAYRKLARRPPPPAAVEMLTTAQADAAQDALPSLASAETKARDSLEVAGPRARFPEAVATLARIRIQWADALLDEAARIGDRNPDDPRVAQLQGDAKAKLKSAFEVLSPAAKADKDAPELQLALADYYRAQRSPSNMNRFLKPFKDDPRAALIQGMALQQEDEGAERAIPRLKVALASDPRSARVHFRLALAYAAGKDETAARAEVDETLRLSPQHERAQALRERLGKPGAAETK